MRPAEVMSIALSDVVCLVIVGLCNAESHHVKFLRELLLIASASMLHIGLHGLDRARTASGVAHLICLKNRAWHALRD